MFLHMSQTVRSTLILSATLMRELKSIAAQSQNTLSQVIESTLRLGLVKAKQSVKKPAPLPTYKMGRRMVDITDRNALYEIMEGRRF